MKSLCLSVVIAALATTNLAYADFSNTKTKLEAAMASEVRTEAEVARDGNRKPIETLEFFGLRDDMTIVELIPGGGWYSKLLAPTVRDSGEYYAALGAGRLEQNLGDKPGFDKMNIVEGGSFSLEEGTRFYNLEIPADGFGVTDADIVFTFRNYHNFTEQGRTAMNEAAFDALKSGGIYAVVDHTARHMEELNNENRRRFDPVLAIKEIQAAGFEFVDYSKIHHRLDDALIYEVGRRSVAGNTDRWTLKFRKP